MCSTPKAKKTKTGNHLSVSLSADMDQPSYSRMIQQANAAYEKRHPESTDLSLPHVDKTTLSKRSAPRSLRYWLTEARISELKQLLIRHISIN